MFVLIWAALLFSVRSNHADTGIKITGNTTVKEGDALNLTFSVEGFSPSVITRTEPDSNKKHKGTKTDLQNNTGTKLMNDTGAKLKDTETKGGNDKQNKTVTNMQNKGETHMQNKTVTHMQNKGETHMQNKTVTDMQNTGGTDTKNKPVTNTQNKTVTAEVNLKINELEQSDQLWKLLGTVNQPQVIIAFLTGILLSAIICCLARKCHREKQKSSGNLAEILEMETMQAGPLIDAGQAVEDDGTHNQEAAEGGAEAAGQWNVEPKEVEYSTIDFFMSKRKSPAEDTEDATETEYAEIKREETEERQDSGGEEAEMLDGNEEEEVMIEEDKEKRQCMQAEEEGGDDVGMCSDVTEILTVI